jgi:hypothetical protein
MVIHHLLPLQVSVLTVSTPEARDLGVGLGVGRASSHWQRERTMDYVSAVQIYEISREDFEKLGRSTAEKEFIQTVIELLQTLDPARAKVLQLEPSKAARYTRSIPAAPQQIGLPVMVKTLTNGIAIALKTDEDRAPHIRMTALTQPPSW